MSQRIIDVRSRPAFLHDFYGARRGTLEFETAKWLNRRVGSKDDEHFTRSHDLAGFLQEVRTAGIAAAVVIGRDTPTIQNTNDEIAKLVSGHRELIGVGSVDPERLGREQTVAEVERAIGELALKAINLEPGFGKTARHFDDRLLFPVYEVLQTRRIPVFLMSGPTTPDLSFNNPSAIGRVARAFPELSIVVHHGAWPNVLEIVGVAFRYANVHIVPDMYIFLPGGHFYVEAANGFGRDQILFGSSFPFRAMAQSVEDYRRIGFSDTALDSIFFENANRVLKLGL